MMAVSDFSKVAQMLDGGAETETPLSLFVEKISTQCILKRARENMGPRWKAEGRGEKSKKEQ